jgi:glycosyltransferase involved in cell wall biosynthesis
MLPGVPLWWYRMLLSGYARSLGPHAVVTVSHSVRNLLARDYRFPMRKMHTVWNGADVERFRPDPDVRAATRLRWGVGSDAIVFGTARRFTRDKGLDLAVEAFRRFRAAHPDRDAYLVLVGDGPERVALHQQAADSGVGDRVVFPGFSTEPWTVYPGFDVFVMPSRSEALSLALTEAMASGCLPIASTVGGSSEVIADPSLGWIVPPDDPAALTRALAEAAGLGDEVRAEMMSRVRARICDSFNAPTQYAKLVSLIEGRRGAPARPATPARAGRSVTCARA